MMDDSTILSIKDYGRIVVKLKPLLEQRGMTRNALARAINTRFEVVDKWYNDQVEKIDADVLARICFVLHCSVEAILEYQFE